MYRGDLWFSFSERHDYYRCHLGRYFLGPLLGLGSERNVGPNYLVCYAVTYMPVYPGLTVYAR